MNENIISQTANVELLAVALRKVISRPQGLPGLAVMYGDSGLGKSVAATYCAQEFKAFHVECRDSWSKKAFLQAMVRVMGITPARTIADMLDQAAQMLVKTGRPLIVDDVQYLLDKGAANILTDLYNASQAPILLVGEERVPYALSKLERLHNRVLVWVPAKQATLKDVRKLASDTYPEVQFDDALLLDLLKSVRGCLRRVALNLYHVYNQATALGLTIITQQDWEREWFTGDAPIRKR